MRLKFSWLAIGWAVVGFCLWSPPVLGDSVQVPRFSSPSLVRVFLKLRTRQKKMPRYEELAGAPFPTEISRSAAPEELFLVDGLSSLAVSRAGTLYELFPGTVREGKLDVLPSLAIRQPILQAPSGFILRGVSSSFLPTTQKEVLIFNQLSTLTPRPKF